MNSLPGYTEITDRVCAPIVTHTMGGMETPSGACDMCGMAPYQPSWRLEPVYVFNPSSKDNEKGIYFSELCECCLDCVREAASCDQDDDPGHYPSKDQEDYERFLAIHVDGYEYE